ncbi:DHHC palmitoyltransferase-domain-containing protein [Trichophaea hybrida]|nr:DHHC palmitoyltransferase-domain-containing protein [Trichophaea hybrida]
MSRTSMSNTHTQPHSSLQATNVESETQGRPYNAWTPVRPKLGATPTNLREFLDKEIFVCENDGLPRYCTSCDCWKPDRSHHCSEVGRCVMRMDHFCPWVGGVVAETSFRYFYQVVVYGALYCIFLLVAMAVLIHERSNNGLSVDAKWIATIALAAVFGIFTAGMTLSTTQLIVGNVSTIDSLSVKTKVYQLAIHDPYPPPLDSTPISNSYRLNVTRVWLPPNPTGGEQQKCFAIVRTERGENPWKLDSTYENFKESLGGGFWQWFLLWGVPKPGSCGGESGWYRWNSALIARLKKEAGIRAEYHNEKVRS